MFDVDTDKVANEIESSGSQGEGDGAPDSAATPQEIHELEKLQKFKFEGKEYTPSDFQKQWKEGTLRQQDYTRKMQEIAKDRDYLGERKFHDNLKFDLQKVRDNPALVNEFKKVYPEKFHDWLEQILIKDEQKAQREMTGQEGKSSYANLDPEVVSRFEKIESYVLEKEISAAEQTLEAYDKEFGGKYNLADPEAVYAKADSLYQAEKKNNPQFTLDHSSWDKLWKADHEKNQKRYETLYRDQINNQRKAGLKAKDVASGGAVPGQAPKTARTIREATDWAIQELDS